MQRTPASRTAGASFALTPCGREKKQVSALAAIACASAASIVRSSGRAPARCGWSSTSCLPTVSEQAHELPSGVPGRADHRNVTHRTHDYAHPGWKRQSAERGMPPERKDYRQATRQAPSESFFLRELKFIAFACGQN